MANSSQKNSRENDKWHMLTVIQLLLKKDEHNLAIRTIKVQPAYTLAQKKLTGLKQQIISESYAAIAERY